MKRYVVGISGASGAIYGIRLVEALLASPGREVHVVLSPVATQVMAEELDLSPCTQPFDAHSIFDVTPEQATRLVYHPIRQVGAGPASGTFGLEAMVIAPCSMRTLGAVAGGLADNLMTRAADVALKEGRPLVLMPRETPFNAIHLENMLRLSRAGAVIMPANPAFYHRPQSIEDLVRLMVQKVFDRLGLEFPEAFRWQGLKR